VKGLVQMLRTENRNMSKLEGERIFGHFRGLIAFGHEVERRDKAGAVGTRLTMD
jgi:hypothetical protein